MRRFVVTLALALFVCLPALAVTLQVPNGVTQEATGPNGAAVTFSVSGTGNGTGDDFNGRPLNGAANITCTPASGSTFAVGTTTVTCTASDSASSTTASFNVVVTDTTAPDLELPRDFSVQASSSDGATVTWQWDSYDLVDGITPVHCSSWFGLYPVGTTVVSCTATDSHGNQSGGSFNITVTYDAPPPPQEAPTIGVPSDITAEATSAAGAAVTFTVTANGHGPDDFNGRPTNSASVTCSPASGSTFALGTTTVTCTATNTAGSATDSFDVTVVDTTGPSLDIPRDFTVQASSNDGEVVTYNAAAADAVDGAVAVDCSPASGSLFPVGTTSVSCTATDASGNSASDGFTVSVLGPGTPPPTPTLNLPSDITAEAEGPDGAVVTFTATSSGGSSTGDDFNGRPINGSSVNCAPASGSVFALGTTTVQCTAGSASGSFLITVVDTTAPALTLPDDITTDQPAVTFDASAEDLVDGSVAVTCTPPSGSTFGEGTTAVNCSATDAAGNSSSGSFNVTVNSSNPTRFITVTASPDKLWPPDHKMVSVTLTVSISDNSAFTAHIVSVASSENDPNDRTAPDWNITGPLSVDLRAEKSEQAQKRTYTILVEVVDDTNTSYLKTVTVTVQGNSNSQRRRAT